jgi:ABC-type uncharacterized transport system substrate-binding protein
MKISELQAEAEAKYTDLPIELDDDGVIRMRNLLRLDDKARHSAQVLIDSLNDKEDRKGFDVLAHQERVLRDLFLLVADDTEAMKREIEEWDLPLKLHILDKWMEQTQVGEASSSAS